MKEIARGAEAVLYQDKNSVIKDRTVKSYRLDTIDTRLRNSRTKREAKVLEKLHKFGFCPKVISQDKNTLTIELIKGEKLRDILEKKDYASICLQIGKVTRKMHDSGIIHGDLTTSNMILADKIYLIDFGLSYFSEKTEDKAVDLHLLKQALESKHHTIWENCFDSIAKGYNDKEVLKRLEKVEQRGRYKGKR